MTGCFILERKRILPRLDITACFSHTSKVHEHRLPIVAQEHVAQFYVTVRHCNGFQSMHLQHSFANALKDLENVLVLHMLTALL